MDTSSVVGNFEFKADSADTGGIKGYGAFYGNLDNTYDVLHKGAFAEISRSIKMLYQHRSDKLIGKWDIVSEDEKGLVVEGNINLNTSMGRDAYELAKSGALTDLSVGFVTKEREYDEEGIRHIKKADLYEVSLVSFPANEKANIISVKSEDIQNERDFEWALKSLGYSNKDAKHIANFGFKSLMHKKETGELKKADELNVEQLTDILKNFTI